MLLGLGLGFIRSARTASPSRSRLSADARSLHASLEGLELLLCCVCYCALCAPGIVEVSVKLKNKKQITVGSTVEIKRVSLPLSM